ncbi:MAG: pilus assembly protein [Chloroflexi bacterium]|nr:pilus assembly protein [Chloroflexota bacterium]
MKLRHSLHRSRRGQSLVEFALVLPILFLITYGVIELSRLSTSWITLRHAADEAVRYAVTGSGFTSGSGVREAAIAETAKTAMRGTLVKDVASSEPCYFKVTIRSSSSTGNPNEANNAGGPNEYVRVTLQYNHPFLIGLIGHGYVPLTVSSLNINERFARPTNASVYMTTPQLPSTPVATFTPTPTPTNTPIPAPTNTSEISPTSTSTSLPTATYTRTPRPTRTKRP